MAKKRFNRQWWQELWEFVVLVIVLLLFGAWKDNVIHYSSGNNYDDGDKCYDEDD